MAILVPVTMQTRKHMPADLNCKDKFLVQSIVANAGLTVKDFTPEMVNCPSRLPPLPKCGSCCLRAALFGNLSFFLFFARLSKMTLLYLQFSKDKGNAVEECKLKAIHLSAPQPPSPVPEGSEEGLSLSENNGSSAATVLLSVSIFIF